MFSDALKAIIDLLKLRKDVKKTDLEIDELERDRKKAEALIQPASFADIKAYDAKTRERMKVAHELLRSQEREDKFIVNMEEVKSPPYFLIAFVVLAAFVLGLLLGLILA